MVIKPRVRGFLCLTAHPVGCEANVKEQINHVTSNGLIKNGPKNVLVIGASGGFGLSSRITAAFGCGATTLGVFFEKEPSETKTASGGWYNSVALEKLAKAKGLKTVSVNGDAFTEKIKDKVVTIAKNEFEPFDARTHFHDGSARPAPLDTRRLGFCELAWRSGAADCVQRSRGFRPVRSSGQGDDGQEKSELKKRTTHSMLNSEDRKSVV